MPDRPRIYLSSCMSNGGTLPQPEREENARFAIEFGMMLMERGFSVYIPQFTEWAIQITGRGLPYDLWIQNDMPWVQASHAIYRLPGESKGADAEVAFAKECGVPMFTDVATMEEHFRTKGML